MKTKILVDGNCIVCDVEVAHYKRMAPELFEIVDISAPNFDASEYDLTPQAVNKHLHVISTSGEVKKGVDAFSHIWSLIPRYAPLNKLLKVPLAKPVANFGYEIFAAVRPWLPKRR